MNFDIISDVTNSFFPKSGSFNFSHIPNSYQEKLP